MKSQCENSFGRNLFPENSGLGALPTIRVDAQWTDPFSYEIYYPKFGDWVSNGGSGSGSSGFGQFTGSASTQTQCQTDTTINPIVIANGKKIQQELDFTTTGEMPLAFIRYYDSFAKGAADFSVNGKWRHSFDYRLAIDPQKNRIRQLPNGENYYLNGLMKIQKSYDEFIVSLPDGGVETYNLNGRLLSKKNAYNIGWTLSYDVDNKLSEVTHTNGRTIKLTWYMGQLIKVTDPARNIYTYNYDIR